MSEQSGKQKIERAIKSLGESQDALYAVLFSGDVKLTKPQLQDTVKAAAQIPEAIKALKRKLKQIEGQHAIEGTKPE